MTPTVTIKTSAASENTVKWIEWRNSQDPLGYIGWDQFEDLAEQFEASIRNPSISSIIIYSPFDHFSPGWAPEAWLNYDAHELEANILRAQRLLQQIQHARKPVIAAINGKCIGPGMELALACHRIVAGSLTNTCFGMEERNLGLVPALGATCRLARRNGLQTALHILLSGKIYSCQETVALRIVQETALPDQLLSAAERIAETLVGKKTLSRKSELSLVQRGVERLWIGKRMIMRQTADRISQTTHPSFIAPGLIMKATEIGWRRGGVEGLQRSLLYCLQAWNNEGTKSLLILRQTALGQQRMALGLAETEHVKRVTVLGAGKMGLGLVKLARRFELGVDLVERNRDRVQVLKKWIQKTGSALYASDAYFPDRPAEVMIESVDENMDRKREVLKDAEKYLDAQGFLATNTSTLSVSDLAASLNQPKRLIGMHFFMPPGAMPLVEIIPGLHTDPKVIQQAKALAAQLDKVWIEVKDQPGFFCTRVLGAYLHESLCLLEEGVDIRKVDYVLGQFGFVLGPFRFMDLVGLDLIQKVLDGPVYNQMQHHGDKQTVGLQALIKQGFLGQKNGKGFYSYGVNSSDSSILNHEVYEWFGGQDRRNVSTVRIQHRIALALVNEAARCLEEGVIKRPEDGDLGAVYGLGFPAFLGGPFRFADRLGISKLVHMLEELTEDHGARFKPAAFFREKVTTGTPIFQK